ncbi:c-type cytochrome [Herbaspirillum sp. RTI4]|uniref:c-type cytochrome n=1 Tax=Herbaspirillum sp. RTI4 TaxID=3048640 RepID=UPI002AB41EE2|nr:c-type cytochrome [Herbaspirillum sp. RTI4]MDY7577012.1 c-type cytochrome [Herbaspirillum sp. RTI4]MEA9983083.1 c-type cytochrome [Herbaspirillum sp. RTI4]
MSDAHKEEHQSAIKTPKQLILAIAAGFLIPIICIVLLVEYVTTEQKAGAGSDGQTATAILARIKPVADAGYTFHDAAAPKQLLSGEEVYKSTCMACHSAGVAGAPKVGDLAAWKARIGQGYDTLVSHAVNGIRAMPAKGGNPDLSDIEIARTVAYMANQAGASFKAPEPKAEPAAPAEKS